MVIRKAAVFLFDRAFLYQPHAAQLPDSLNDSRALQLQRGAYIVVAIPKPSCAAVSAFTEEQVHSCLCRGKHIFEKATADKEKIPSCYDGKCINKCAELFVIIIVAVNAFDVAEPTQRVGGVADCLRRLDTAYLFQGFLAYLYVLVTLVNRAAAQAVESRDHLKLCRCQVCGKNAVWQLKQVVLTAFHSITFS